MIEGAQVESYREGSDFGIAQRLDKEILGAKPVALSPIHHVSEEAPPTWITYGSLDRLVPIKTTKAFLFAMR